MSLCELCTPGNATLLWQSERCRVIRVAEGDYPGFCRVIWQAHVREITDLPAPDRSYCMAVVFAVEEVVRELFRPDKINLASFGNMVPHLHWHIIPRWRDDPHFPEPVWGRRQRENGAQRPDVDDNSLIRALAQRLNSLHAPRETEK